MSAFLRIGNFITGILMVLVSLMILLFPEDGHLILITCISIALLAAGLHSLFFYVTMARHMVGGKAFLFRFRSGAVNSVRSSAYPSSNAV